MKFLRKIQAKYGVRAAKNQKGTNLSGLSVKLWDDTYKVGAEHWGNASSPVYEWGDGDWVSSQYQVADFRHSPEKALRQIIEDSLIGVEIDENIEKEIDDAIKRAKVI